MPDFEQVLTVKRAVENRLLGLPGVHAVGVGAKTVGGQRTAEPSIVVYLVEKKPLSALRPVEIIPPEIDGVKTDVIQAPMPVMTQGGEDEAPRAVLLGGIQIWGGTDLAAKGTLGCIAETNEVNRRIMVLTCNHVIRTLPVHGHVSPLQVNVLPPDDRQVVFANRSESGTTIVVFMTVFPPGGSSQEFEFHIRATPTDTLTTLAQTFANRVNGLHPAIHAAVAPTGTTVNITGDAGAFAFFLIQIFAPGESDSGADLNTIVRGNVVTFTGKVSGDFYGVHTLIYMAGTPPRASQGVFKPLAKNQSLESVASSVADAVNVLGVPGLTATATGAVVTVAGADLADAWVTGDTRVGHPKQKFPSRCCDWCSHRIGFAVNGRVDVDAGLVQLDPGIKYKAEIEEIGFITGSHTVTPAEAMGLYPVRKRGRTTHLTNGFVETLDVTGFVDSRLPDQTQPGTGIQFATFFRRYQGAMRIQGLPPNPALPPGPGNQPVFALGGDSGSAVVNAAKEVVAIVFSSDPTGQFAAATPIQTILDRLDIRIATATQLNDVRTVPQLAGAQAADAPPTVERMREVEAEIAAIPAGKSCVDIVRRHLIETQQLVNHKRAVGVAWHRNGGPALVDALAQTLESPDRPLPLIVAGKPLDQCVDDIAAVLRSHASQSLISDLDRFVPMITGLGGKTYSDVLERLRSAAVSPNPGR